MSDQEGPGGRLRAAREAMEVSVREVSDVLNLPVHVIEALEANDQSRLPGPVFARGYVRAYAKLLELDPEPLVAAYRMPETAPAVSTVTTEVVSPWRRLLALLDQRLRQNPLPVVIVGGLLLLVLLIALIVSLLSSADSTADQAAGTAADSAAAMADTAFSGGSGGLSPAAPVSDAIVPEPAEPDHNAPPAVEVGSGAPSETTAASPAAAATDVSVSDGSDAVRAERLGAGTDELRFSFVDECWVEVKSIDGRTLYSDLSRPGQDLRLTGQGPFRVLLGYAPGARMFFNGEPVALAPHTRNNVATLVIGQ